jgi:hypothetical protein
MSAPKEPDEGVRYWLIYFEDRDVPPEVFAYEDAARARYKALLDNWNCHLFMQVSKNGKEIQKFGPTERCKENRPVHDTHDENPETGKCLRCQQFMGGAVGAHPCLGESVREPEPEDTTCGAPIPAQGECEGDIERWMFFITRVGCYE